MKRSEGKAQVKFKALSAPITATLKERGFSQKGTSYFLPRSDNWEVLGIQKSRRSTADEITFTINLGVCSRKLLEYFSPGRPQKVSIETSHWRIRIGRLLPERQDKWWVLSANQPLEPLLSELKNCISMYAIPELENHITDEQLCQNWLAGNSPGLTEIQRLMNLSVLLEAKGDLTNLQEILKELKIKSEGTPGAAAVSAHLNRF